MTTPHIGSYRLDRVLGTGSFATVWLAFDEQLDAPVAIKVLADNWARNAEIRRRFIDEARLLRRIDDDRIVRVYTVGELPDGRPYFVMAWADRGTLLDRMQARTPPRQWDLTQALRVALGVSECLSVVHAFGIVHRDIKPSNVLFRTLAAHQRSAGPDERILLGDFGLAKDLVSGSGFTMAAGTPAYMAPEQAQTTSALDVRADLFATAAVLYELLTGHPAYAADTLSSARAGTRARPERLAVTRPDLPAGVQALLDRGLDPDPAGRYSTAVEWSAALRALLPAPADGRPAAGSAGGGQATGGAPAAGGGHTAGGAPAAGGGHTAGGAPAAGGAIAPGAADPDGRGWSAPAWTGAPAWAGAPAWTGMPAAAEGGVEPVWGPPVPVAASVGPAAGAWATSHAAAGVTPLVAVRALVGQARSVLGDGPAWQQAAAHLEATMRVVVSGPIAPVATVAAALTDATGGAAEVVVATEADRVADLGPDAVLYVGVAPPAGGYAGATGRALTRGAGPVSVAALVDGIVTPGGGGADDPADQAVAWAERQRDSWWDAARAGRALDDVDAGLAVAGPAPGADRLRAQAELIRLAHPAIGEVAILAEEASGALSLPAPLRDELRRVLAGGDPAERLGAEPGTSPAEIRRLGAEGASRWRALSNAGRIPFTARGAAAVVARAYDRLAVTAS